MNCIVIASHNEGKVREIGELLAPLGLEVISAGSLGLPEPEETETTFEGNAELKARAACAASGLPALADDSGLVIPAIGGQPGIYSARWAPNKDFSIAFERIKRELEHAGAPLDSPAYFVCALSLALPSPPCPPASGGDKHGGKVPPFTGGFRGEQPKGCFGQKDTTTRNLATMPLAKALRYQMTQAEYKLWGVLSASKLGGFKFRRQQTIGDYIVDFVCMKAKLIIEIDGSQHIDNSADQERTAWLTSQGYHVLRFWNNEVMENIEGVATVILEHLHSPQDIFPPKSPRKRGDFMDERKRGVRTFLGRIDGRLCFPPRGEKGFGYDPIFIADGYTQTFAEIDPQEKHAISHRARAFKALMERLHDLQPLGLA